MVINDFINVLAFLNEWWIFDDSVHSIQLKTKEVLLEILLKKCRPVSMDAGIVGVTLHVLPVVHILSIKLSPGDGTAIFRFTCATCILFVFNWKAKWWILSGWFSGSSSWHSWENTSHSSRFGWKIILSVHFFWESLCCIIDSAFEWLFDSHW